MITVKNASRVCARCSSSKAKCDRQIPCGRCRQKGFECVPQLQTKKRLNDVKHEDSELKPAADPIKTEPTNMLPDGKLISSCPEVVKHALSWTKECVGGCVSGISSGLSQVQHSISFVLSSNAFLGMVVAVAMFSQFRREVTKHAEVHQKPQRAAVFHLDKLTTPAVYILHLLSCILCIDSRVLAIRCKYNIEEQLHRDMSWLPDGFPHLYDSTVTTHLSLVVLGHLRRITNMAWELDHLSPAETDQMIANDQLSNQNPLYALNQYALMSVLNESEHESWVRNFMRNMMTGFQYLKQYQGYYWLYESVCMCNDRRGNHFMAKVSVHTFIKSDGALCARGITIKREHNASVQTAASKTAAVAAPIKQQVATAAAAPNRQAMPTPTAAAAPFKHRWSNTSTQRQVEQDSAKRLKTDSDTVPLFDNDLDISRFFGAPDQTFSQLERAFHDITSGADGENLLEPFMR